MDLLAVLREEVARDVASGQYKAGELRAAREQLDVLDAVIARRNTRRREA